ncbi:phosphatidylglycerophosphatase A [Paracoccaceae bacterium GXU_MW_L88]
MRQIATLFGIGHLKPAPGTWGSAASLILGLIAHLIGGFPLLALLTLAATLLGFWSVAQIVGAGHDDPSEIVIDEMAGQLLALWPLSFGLWHAGFDTSVIISAWPGWVGAFLLFRLFDIWKPFPVSRADNLPGALGVMLDDLVAGGIAALIIAIGARLAHG